MLMENAPTVDLRRTETSVRRIHPRFSIPEGKSLSSAFSNIQSFRKSLINSYMYKSIHGSKVGRFSRLGGWAVALSASFVIVSTSHTAIAGAVRPGFNGTVLPANDDGSTPRVDVGFWLNFFGAQYSKLYVNNNGNLTFDGPLSTYTPAPIASAGLKIIAPFWADVDTRGIGSDVVRYSFGTGIVNGRNAFGANYVNVGYYQARANKLNSFQVVLIDRSDVGPGDFDIEYNYDKVQWETGDASGGSGGVGGRSARVGYANGSAATLELGGSGTNGAFLDSNLATGLVYNSLNSGVPGRYIFEVRNGGVVNAPPVANAGADIVSAPNANVALNGAGSYDPENSPITYSWTQLSGSQVVINNPQSATPNFVAPAGNYSFKLTVSDGVLSSFDTVDVIVGIPVASTRPASGITHNAAILHGTVNPAGVQTTYRFSYGPVGGPTIFTPNQTVSGNAGAVSVSANLTGLTPTTPYTFRLLATNENGASEGDALPFTTATTPVIPPSVSITSPENGANFLENTVINIAANAADSDGSVVKVEFFDGAVKIGEDTSAPYTQTVNGLAIGEHTFRALATDNVGATGQSAPVVVNINSLPNLHAPIAGNDGPLAVPVSHYDVLVNDTDGDGDPLLVTGISAASGGTAVLESDGTVSYTPGPTFTGTDSFTYTLSDGRGLTSVGTVTVADVAPPVITFNPQLVSASTGTSPTAPIPNVAALVSATDNVAVVSKTQSPAAGTLKAPGSYEVTVTVADAAGNTATCIVLVTISDGASPEITFTPGPQIAYTGNNPGGPVPNVASLVTATDNVAVVSKTQAPLAGTMLPPGVYAVVVTVADGDGNSAQTTVQVSVLDNASPVITSAPASQLLTTGDNATISIPSLTGLVSANDNIGVVSITQTPIAGLAVGPGSYTVVLTAADAAGNTATAEVAVSVVDNSAPVFTKIPAPRTINAPTDESAVAVPDFASESLATDNIGVVSISQNPAAGTIVEPGTYVVTLTASDAAGNATNATVELITRPGNRTPIAAYDSAFAMDRTLTLNVLANDSDPDGDAITLQSFTQPARGRVTRAGNSLRFDPDLFVPSSGESFTYTITDGLATATATVEITPIPEGRRFSGLVSDNDGPNGLITFAFTVPGHFTGYVNANGRRHVFSGGMSTTLGIGVGNVSLNRTTLIPMTVRPAPRAANGNVQLLLGFSDNTLLPNTEFLVEQSPYWRLANAPVAQYAVALTKHATAPGPKASGYAMIKVTKNGATTHVGRGANGQPFTSSGQLLSENRLGFHGALGGVSPLRGFLAGMLEIDSTGNFVSGDIRWKLPPNRDKHLLAGIDTTVTAIGDRYARATTPQGIFLSSSPVVRTFELSEGVFGTPVSASVTLDAAARATVFDEPFLYFGTVPASGRIWGFVRPPDGSARHNFDGIILPIRGEIYGSIRNATILSAMESL
jgi:hypothetical protein